MRRVSDLIKLRHLFALKGCPLAVDYRLFMQEQNIIQAIVSAIPGAQVEARMEGNHAHVTVTSSAFEGLSPVKRQQLVYGALNTAIASGAIHAVHMKTLVPEAQ